MHGAEAADLGGGWGHEVKLEGQISSGSTIGAASSGADGSAFKAVSGNLTAAAFSGGDADVVTTAMFQHLAREFTGSFSLWPQNLQEAARRYFSVTHGYVLRKLLWLAVPLPTAKKSHDGEINDKKDWTSRVFEGLEVDLEEPDLYLPSMGFITYVLLCGVTLGIQERFQPDALSTTVSYVVTLLILEVCVVKGALMMTGASAAPIFDLVAILGYKYCYLAVQVAAGLLLGFGKRPSGFLYHLLTLALCCSCGAALWQTLRRLQRMQPIHAHGQDVAVELHSVVVKVIPVLQVVLCWFLIPSWPKPDASSAAHPAGASSTTLRAVAQAAAQAVTTTKLLVPPAGNASSTNR